MTIKFYKINGVYNTWQYWHENLGYTMVPSTPITYKSAEVDTWGEATAASGYYYSPFVDGALVSNLRYFVGVRSGWWSLNELALIGYFPSNAVNAEMEKAGQQSPAVKLTLDEIDYYLVRDDVSLGWCTLGDLEDHGWVPYEGMKSLIIVEEATGNIIYSISDNGLELSPVGHVEMPDPEMITVYETGVRTESFYFTANGRNEAQNTDISNADIPVYLEDGTSPAADTPYDGSAVMAFMDVKGNTKQSDGESLYVDDGVLRLDALDTDEGEQWAALVEYIEPAPSNQIELDLGLWYTNNAWKKFEPPALDTNYSGLLSQEDADAVTAFGLTTTTDASGAGPIGGIVANAPSDDVRYRFEFELLALYSDIVDNHGSGSQTFDPTNFSVVRGNESGKPIGLVLIKNQSAYQTNVSAWRLRVTKYDDVQYIDVLFGLRWDVSHWRTVNFNYDSGNYWYGGIMSAEDQQRLIDFGCSIYGQNSTSVGTYGGITYDGNKFAYEVIGIYSDVDGTIDAQYDLSTLSIKSDYTFSIWCNVKNANNVITWRCRIIKR